MISAWSMYELYSSLTLLYCVNLLPISFLDQLPCVSQAYSTKSG